MGSDQFLECVDLLLAGIVRTVHRDVGTYGIRGHPRWAELRRLAAEANFEEMTSGIGWTQSALGIRQKLDAVFASPQGLPQHAWRAPLPGSAHVPVLVDLELPITASRPRP